MKRYPISKCYNKLPTFIKKAIPRDTIVQKKFREVGLTDFITSSDPILFWDYDKFHTALSKFGGKLIGILSRLEELEKSEELDNMVDVLSIFICDDPIYDGNKIGFSIYNSSNSIIFRRGTPVSSIIKSMIETCFKYPKTKKFVKPFKDLIEYTKDTKLNVVFSTDPLDIATMSMRGIDSCMTWGGPYSTSLVGSILCPYTAIIYLTGGDSKTFKYGKIRINKPRMIAREVVRLCKNKKSGKFHIYTEGVYMDCDYDYDRADLIHNLFGTALQKYSNISVVRNRRPLFIPLSPATRNLRSEYATYSDNGIKYR